MLVISRCGDGHRDLRDSVIGAEGPSHTETDPAFSYGCVFFVDCAEEKRLARTPVGNVRQATTTSDLQGANHE